MRDRNRIIEEYECEAIFRHDLIHVLDDIVDEIRELNDSIKRMEVKT